MPNYKIEIITPDRPNEWLRETADAFRDCLFYQQWNMQPFVVDSIYSINRAVLLPAEYQADLIEMFSLGCSTGPLS